MGRIALPSFLAQAAAPSLGALLMQRFGPDTTLAMLFATAIFAFSWLLPCGSFYRGPANLVLT